MNPPSSPPAETDTPADEGGSGDMWEAGRAAGKAPTRQPVWGETTAVQGKESLRVTLPQPALSQEGGLGAPAEKVLLHWN